MTFKSNGYNGFSCVKHNTDKICLFDINIYYGLQNLKGGGMLANYINISQALEKLFYPYLEIVIHDLKSHKIIFIANNFSNRNVDDESILNDLQFPVKQDIIGPYEKINYDGKILKSISIFLDLSPKKYLMCLNFDCSQLCKIQSVIDIFLNKEFYDKNAAVFFKDDWQEKINIYLNQTLRKMAKTVDNLSKEEKKRIVADLEKQGAFIAKNSKEYIAKLLNISRATVYNYLNN